jgi:uncharacterized ParB-like nuclease family protein
MDASYTERALKDGREKRKKPFEEACCPKQAPNVLDEKPPLPQKLNTSREVREWQDVALQLREQLERDGKIRRINVHMIEVGKRLREINEVTVASLMDSIQEVGQLQPISVHLTEDCKTMRLIAGAHRLQAMKQLGLAEIDAVFVSGDEIQLELHEISENLHRAELTPLERDIQVARWIELTTTKQAEVSSQVETKPQGGRPEGGVNAASRELGISKADAHRAMKVAGMSEEAKQAARDVGLDDNRGALLEVAREKTPKKQVAKVREIAAFKGFQKMWKRERHGRNSSAEPKSTPAVQNQVTDAREKETESPLAGAEPPPVCRLDQLDVSYWSTLIAARIWDANIAVKAQADRKRLYEEVKRSLEAWFKDVHTTALETKPVTTTDDDAHLDIPGFLRRQKD